MPAVKEYHEAIRLNPASPGAYYNLGRALDQKDDLKAAIAEYRKAIDLAPTLAEAHYRLGRDLRDTGDATEGLSELQKASALEPNNATYSKAAKDLQQQMSH